MRRIAASVALCLAFATEAPAADDKPADARTPEKAYGLDFVIPGMTVAQLRTTRFPGGLRLVCGTDRELPQIDPADKPALTVPEEMAKAGADHCAVFGPEPKHKTFQIQQTKLAGNPADFWILAVVDDFGAQRVAQVLMAQPNTNFADTVDYFSQRFGTPQQRTTTTAHWKNGRGEAMVNATSSGETRIFLVDNHLQALLTERISQAKKK